MLRAFEHAPGPDRARWPIAARAFSRAAFPSGPGAWPTCRLLDPKFRRQWPRYVAQCVAATGAILVVLLVLNAVTQTVLIAALGASTFIAFTMPHVKSSGPRYLVGGYVVGTTVGTLISMLAALVEVAPADAQTLTIALGALTIGIAMLCMVATNTEHPPAAGLALGFVLNEWDLATLFAVLAGIVAVAALKQTFRPRMIDLL